MVIAAFQTAMPLAAAVNSKAHKWVDGRRNWHDTVQTLFANNKQPVAWFHAASLGEFEQGKPVMEAFRAAYPKHKILLTFFSPSGYEVRKNYEGADFVLYLPADTPDNARRFISLIKPAIAFFIKYEFWYNYLRELKKADIPVISFSAIFRPNQLFFKPWGGFYRNMLGYFDHILVQNHESAVLLADIGVTNVTLAGDTRFDRVAQTVAAKQAIPLAAAFKDGKPLLVVGSAWPEDMNVLIPFLNTFGQPLKFILAPHEIHSDEIERWRNQLSKPSILFSEAAVNTVSGADVLIIDNVGMLSSLYKYGEFAYIGGAFRQGLHNILEAATFGMPLFFGPEYSKYQEAADLVKLGAAFPIRTATELTTAFINQYDNPAKVAQISRAYVQRNIGATAKVMQIVKQIMNE